MIEILQAFILLVVIMDPVLSLVAFLSLTKGKKPGECTAIAIKGTAVAALIFCGTCDRAHTVIANGKVVVKDKRLMSADEDEIFHAANAESERLLKDIAR